MIVKNTKVKILGTLELTDSFESVDLPRIERSINNVLERFLSTIKSSDVELEIIPDGNSE